MVGCTWPLPLHDLALWPHLHYPVCAAGGEQLPISAEAARVRDILEARECAPDLPTEPVVYYNLHASGTGRQALGRHLLADACALGEMGMVCKEGHATRDAHRQQQASALTYPC